MKRKTLKKKRFLIISLVVNLGALGFFKYFNFFLENIEYLFPLFGIPWEQSRLNIILPVGISFYTFQSLSYTVDIYRKKMNPEKNFLNFALYVAFFPQLVAGPIERAKKLIPQIGQKRTITKGQFAEGMYLFYIGLFKKVFIADNLAPIVNRVFSVPASEQSGLEILLGVYAFSFQIYGDFSGYSDMARGLSKMMGFDLMLNFNIPYFALNPQDFWRRWHISFSTWLRDYLYIPLGGSRGSSLFTCRNIAITMLIGGLWHGAAWTFVIWGAYQGIILIVHRLCVPVLKSFPFKESAIWRWVRIICMYQMACIGWLIFRAESWSQICSFSIKILTDTSLTSTVYSYLFQFIFYSWFLIGLQIFKERRQDQYAFNKLTPITQSCGYVFMGVSIFLLGNFASADFIYFQF